MTVASFFNLFWNHMTASKFLLVAVLVPISGILYVTWMKMQKTSASNKKEPDNQKKSKRQESDERPKKNHRKQQKSVVKRDTTASTQTIQQATVASEMKELVLENDKPTAIEDKDDIVLLATIQTANQSLGHKKESISIKSDQKQRTNSNGNNNIDGDTSGGWSKMPTKDEEQMQHLKNRIFSLTKALEETESSRLNAEKKLESSRGQLTLLEQQLKDQYKTFGAKSNSYESEASALRRQIESMRSQLDREISERNQKIESETALLTQAKKTTEDEINRISTILSQTLATVQAQDSELKSVISELKSKDEVIVTLNLKIDEITSDHVAILNSKIQKNDQLSMEIDDLQSKLTTIKTSRDEAVEQVKELNQKIEETCIQKDEICKETESNISIIEKLKEENSTLQTQGKEFESKIMQLTTQITNLEDQKGEISKGHLIKEEEYKKTIQELRNENEKINQRYKELSSILSSKEKHFEEAIESNEKTKNETINQLESQVKTLYGEISSLQLEREELKGKLSHSQLQTQDAINDAKNVLDKLAVAKDDAERQVSLLIEEKKGLQSKIEEIQSSFTVEKKGTTDALRDIISDKEGTIQELYAKLEEQSNISKQLSEEKDSLQDQKSKLQSLFQSTMQQYKTESQKEKESLEMHIKSLEHQISNCHH